MAKPAAEIFRLERADTVAQLVWKVARQPCAAGRRAEPGGSLARLSKWSRARVDAGSGYAQVAEAMASESIEDYIKAVFHLGADGTAVQTSALAQRLGVRPASVSNMLRRLASLGLVDYEPYRGASLSEAGESMARGMVRRHRLIERFLTQLLDYPWEEVHTEAERLEHAVSPRFVEALDRLLERPRTDPHGAPIPARDGTMDELAYPSLVEIGAGEQATVRRVRDSDPELLRYLGEIGIKPGVTVEIVDTSATADVVGVRLQESLFHLGRSAAAGVYVELVTQTEPE